MLRRAAAVLAVAFVLIVTATEPFAVAAARDYTSSVSPLPKEIRQLMIGSSWRAGCPVPLSDLRLVTVTYWGFDAAAHMGRLVVHRWYAEDLARVFHKLYDARFPIRRVRLVDRYGGDDQRSMAADNTSAFNCRYRDGVCCRWSMHAYGKAIDINPVENPYIGPWGVSPDAGADFLDRTDVRPGMLVKKDRAWWAFHAIGWEWGGTWTDGTKDYQHFSSNGR